MRYKITEVLPKWNNYTMKIFLPTGVKILEFENGIARTDQQAIAERFKKNLLRYRVEEE